MNNTAPMTRWKWTITGGVQGVGFRPFVYKTALHAGVTGHVGNTSEGVAIEIQGLAHQLEQFEQQFTANLPPLALLVDWQRETIADVDGESAFTILKSTGSGTHHVLISPDVATCADCLADILEPGNRRFHYPFTNCTNCGPRYTITKSIPYDRVSTSMACFPMCPQCQKEYEDPLDRRFHAQPNACPTCGPQVWLVDNAGRTIARHDNALRETTRLLMAGQILAVKGLGGFHLVCDARNAEAVHTLRTRKRRQDKPLAVMVRDADTARAIAHLSPEEEQLLLGRERPIVLLRARENTGLAPGLSPDTDFLGLMLPYTPLHHVLFAMLAENTTQPVLVMTSGNISANPICLGNREALRALGSLADAFLFHNRDILIRCDDSVVRHLGKAPQFIRRARGYTPSPIVLATDGPTVLGVGALLKNTLCLTKGSQAFVSQHLGDLENLETFTFFEEIANHLRDILQVSPQAVVHDLHPDYMSTAFARRSGLPQIPLQHHFAHIHAVLAENRRQGPALGLALDGTGLGTDDTIWGGELLLVDPTTLRHERLGHLRHVLQPGGDAATREPWRMARAYLHALGITAPTGRPWPWLEHHAKADRIVGQMLDKGINSPRTSSCGRLFDAVSAMLGLCPLISYEGQAAIRLEAVQEDTDLPGYSCPVLRDQDGLVLDTVALFAQAYDAWNAHEPAARISRNFHRGLMRGLAAMCRLAAEQQGISVVGLSGGVMLNAHLGRELPSLLRESGLLPLCHHQLPPGDACISLGQAVYGQSVLQQHEGN